MVEAGCHFQERHGWERPGYFLTDKNPKVSSLHCFWTIPPFNCLVMKIDPFYERRHSDNQIKVLKIVKMVRVTLQGKVFRSRKHGSLRF